MTALPTTVTVDYQPYGLVTLGSLSWVVETHRDYNNGGTRELTVLRGVVLKGTERGYLFGSTSDSDLTGQPYSVYGVTEAELSRGHIVRVAG